MKKHFMIAAAIAAICVSCTKDNIIVPEPTPVPKNLTIVDNTFTIYDLIEKTDTKTGNTFLESWEGVNSYTPRLQCVGPDGKLKWDKWLPLTSLQAVSTINRTLFDITTAGNVIDIYNARSSAKTDGVHCVPYITMIRPDGTKAWGENGKLFYDFGALSNIKSPIEGIVAADNNGGAWIVAGSPRKQLAVARVNADGDFVVKPILLNPDKGTSGVKDNIYRPQLIVNDNNDLFMVVQYVNYVGEGQDMIVGYTDVIKISADGQVLNQQLLIAEESFHMGTLARLYKDGKGGVYASWVSGLQHPTIKLYHFDADGNVAGFNAVNLLPQGSSAGAMKLVAAVDPATGNFNSVLCDDGMKKSDIYFQSVDLTGKTTFSGPGIKLIDMPEGDHFSSMMKFVRTEDNRYLLTYVYNMNNKGQYLYKAWVDVQKGSTVPECVVRVDYLVSGMGSYGDTDAVYNNHLRLFWHFGGHPGIYLYDLSLN